MGGTNCMEFRVEVGLKYITMDRKKQSELRVDVIEPTQTRVLG